MVRQRTYINGQLYKTSKPINREKARQWLSNIERDWLKNGLFPLTLEGEWDTNNAHEVTRISDDELIIVTTGNRKLRYVNVPVK